jgi:hypothetical protein
VSHEGEGEADEPLGDPCRRHQLAGEYEQRNGDQRERVDAVEHLLRQERVGDVLPDQVGEDHVGETGHRDGPGDLHAEEDEEDEQTDEREKEHDAFST